MAEVTALQNLTKIDYVILNAGILRYPNVRLVCLGETNDEANGSREQLRCKPPVPMSVAPFVNDEAGLLMTLPITLRQTLSDLL